MDNKILQEAVELNTIRRKRTRWQKIVIAMAAMVVFCTTYALILPAITVENTVICGIEEHTHAGNCYELRTTPAQKTMLCTVEMVNPHTHTAECYDADGNLICGKSTAFIHVHDEACYDAQGNLVCALPETPAHAHTAECYDADGNLTCGKNELVAHTHTAECYDADGKLICEKIEVMEHQHTAGCYVETEAQETLVLVCKQAEHVHADSCYTKIKDSAPVYYCGKEAHEHTEDCYNADGSLKCTIAEHAHTKECLIEPEKGTTETVSEAAAQTEASSGEKDPSDTETTEPETGAEESETQTEFSLEPEINPEDELVGATGTAIGTRANFTSNLPNGGTYYLTADLTILSTVTIASGKTTTLDLNGHALTVGNSNNQSVTLFDVKSGGTLIIKDSANTTSDVVTTQSGTVYGNTGSCANGTLTYYVTETEVVNSDTGATSETLKKHVVTMTGRIRPTSGQSQPCIKNAGTLTIESGAIVNFNNGAINMTGGTLNLNGGYIAGNGSSRSNGGGINVTGGTVNLRGSIVAANSCTGNGAGIYQTAGTFNMSGGAVASNTCGGYGAGVYLKTTTGKMTGGYITNNKSTKTGDYYAGGGGVCMEGTMSFTMQDGYVTGNYAASGAGLYTRNNSATTLNITDGYVTANYAATGEGGGIRIDASGVGNITGGYITNNITNTHQHWGGGGLFCADGATVYLISTLVTDNEAGGFGGGLAGCSTGRIYLSEIDNTTQGSAIFDNEAAGEHLSGSDSAKPHDHTYAAGSEVFMNNGFDDYFCALYSHVIDDMLGGGSQNWSGSVDGVQITIPQNGQATGNSMTGLSADPTTADKRSAESHATVFINGNSSYTHGGGILCNGFMVLGTPPDEIDVGSRLELAGTKSFLGSDGKKKSITEKQFTFTVTDANGNVVSTGYSETDGTITFDRRLTFDSAGTFVYYVTEDPDENADVTSDSTVFRLTVNTKRVANGSVGTIPKYIFQINTVTVDKQEPGQSGWTNIGTNSYKIAETSGNSLTLSDTNGETFTNYQMSKKNITVVKRWEGTPAGSVSVTLYRNGARYASRSLSSSNNWTYTWTDLDVKDGNSVPYVYEVREDAVPGYMATYAEYSEVTSDAYWVPATSLEANAQYMIVRGNNALYQTDAHLNAAFTSSDVKSISSALGSGTISVGGSSYSTWYDPSKITDDHMTFTAQAYNGGIIFKNNAMESWLLVQNVDGQYLKGCSQAQYASLFEYHNKLQGRYNWDKDGDLYDIIYSSSKFTASTSSTSSNRVTLYKLVSGAASGETTVTITNVPIEDIEFSMELTKVSKTDNSIVLPGAKFRLLDSDGNPLRFTVDASGQYIPMTSGGTEENTYLMTDASGKIRIGKMQNGTYTLHETDAPRGYEIAEDISVTLDENTPDAKCVITVEDPEWSYRLPDTGGAGTLCYMIGGSLLLATGVVYGYFLRQRKRRIGC